jgi:hypothetical protein
MLWSVTHAVITHAEPSDLAGFLCGFRAQTYGDERSVAFHRALGFEVEAVEADYDGRGQARVKLVKKLG